MKEQAKKAYKCENQFSASEKVVKQGRIHRQTEADLRAKAEELRRKFNL